MSISPFACNSQALAQMTAAASAIYYPQAPEPRFFSNSSCGGEVFPQASIGSSCPDTGVTKLKDNCLRIVDHLVDPVGSDVTLSASQVNYLPGNDRKIESNILKDAGVLHSWFCPPGFMLYFFKVDPSTVSLKAAAAQGYLMVGENSLQVSSCLSFVMLNNGEPFFKYKGVGKNANGIYEKPDCLQAWCQGSTCQGNVEASDLCKNPRPCVNYICPASPSCPDGICPPTCPPIEHNAPYLVVVRRRRFSDMIIDMCVNRVPYYLGTPSNSLNRVWSPQSSGCDNFMQSLCQLNRPENAEVCSCFTQQALLDRKFGADLQVSVCCFGQDESGDLTKSCYTNDQAYKTEKMQRQCCSLAQCDTILQQSPDLVLKNKDTKITCSGQLVQIPQSILDKVPAPTPSNPFPTTQTVTVKSIPFYTWVILGIAVICLLIFIVALMFL